jgi:pimeloyl-ACP methyl ester carboxylesterase
VKRWRLALAVAGTLLLAIGAYWIRRAELPSKDIIVDASGCHTPITIIEPPASVAPAGSVILLHGLSANRRVMSYLGSDFAAHGLRTYMPDLPGHGDNRDRFSFAKAQECAASMVEYLDRTGVIDLTKTILIGHSMGGDIAIRLADREPAVATVAISPGPLNLPRRIPANLLVTSAQYDFGPLKRQAQAIADAAGSERIAPDDFAQKRAFQLQHLAGATHTSVLLDRNVARQAETWAMQALFPSVTEKTAAPDLDLPTYQTSGAVRRRLAGALGGLIGILCILPFAVEIASRLSGSTQEDSSAIHLSCLVALTEVAVISLAAVLVLTVWVPLKFLHIYTGDYLASLMLISGVLLLALNWNAAKSARAVNWRALVCATILGFAVILGTGAWLNWQLTDLWMNGPRWARFMALLPIAWIFCFAEEVVLGNVGHGTPRALRFAMFLGLRLELWLACVLAYYELVSGQALIVLLFAGLAAFSILQGLVTSALRRRTGAPAAASLFGAILFAWFIGAVFPLT